MQKTLGYIIKVFYFVPLVGYKSAVAVFSKAYRGGNYCVVRVGFTISPNMKCKTVGIKTLLDTVTNIADGFTPQGYPVVLS